MKKMSVGDVERVTSVLDLAYELLGCVRGPCLRVEGNQKAKGALTTMLVHLPATRGLRQKE